MGQDEPGSQPGRQPRIVNSPSSQPAHSPPATRDKRNPGGRGTAHGEPANQLSNAYSISDASFGAARDSSVDRHHQRVGCYLLAIPEVKAGRRPREDA